jgi:hypothetical protein
MGPQHLRVPVRVASLNMYYQRLMHIVLLRFCEMVCCPEDRWEIATYSVGLLPHSIHRRVHQHRYQSWLQCDPAASRFQFFANIPAVLLGIRGIRNNRRNGNDQVVDLCYATLIFVGVGSAAYHLNLKYVTQMSMCPPVVSDSSLVQY